MSNTLMLVSSHVCGLVVNLNGINKASSLLLGFNADPGRVGVAVGTSRCSAYFICGSLMAWSPLC